MGLHTMNCSILFKRNPLKGGISMTTKQPRKSRGEHKKHEHIIAGREGEPNLAKARQGRWILRDRTSGRILVDNIKGSSITETKAMKEYKKKVTASPEAAKAFLHRIGAFDIK